MTLKQLTDSLKSISLSHKEVNDFNCGEDFLLATGKGDDYPLAFLEIPFSLTYESDQRFKTISFSFLVLMPSAPDDVKGDLDSISEAEVIGEAILSKFRDDNRTAFQIDSINAVSLREFSDDNVSGVRYDITGRVLRQYCNNNYQSKFN